MLFRDTETGNIITEKELYSEWKILFENAETDSNSFSEYIRNCTDKNGTLEII